MTSRPSLTPGRALLFGTLTVGGLDALDAIVFFGLRGVTPTQIFQSIAAGLLGRPAFKGGAPTAWLGLVLHFVIAGSVVGVYQLASRRLPQLVRHPLVCGIAYGLLVYAVMNLVVIPLSATRAPPRSLPILLNGLLIHAFGVGVPSALFARALGPGQTGFTRGWGSP
jgi:hypothetical protein